MESEDEATGASIVRARCHSTCRRAWRVSAVAVRLTSDVDYTIQPAADGSGKVVLLRNADAIIAPLATLARSRAAAAAQDASRRTTRAAQPRRSPPPAPSRPQPTPRRPASAARARASIAPMQARRARSRSAPTRASPPSIATWPRNTAAPGPASPEQQALLRRTRDRFLAYRDRCPNRAASAMPISGACARSATSWKAAGSPTIIGG